MKDPGERFGSQLGGAEIYALQSRRRSHTAVFLKTHEHTGDFKEP